MIVFAVFAIEDLHFTICNFTPHRLRYQPNQNINSVSAQESGVRQLRCNTSQKLHILLFRYQKSQVIYIYLFKPLQYVILGKSSVQDICHFLSVLVLPCWAIARFQFFCTSVALSSTHAKVSLSSCWVAYKFFSYT